VETPFKVPLFYPILDTSVLAARGCAAVSAGRTLIEAGVKILQYRHKDDWRQANFDEAAQLSEFCQSMGVLFVLNDRADFARLLKSALHVGQSDLSPVAARGIVRDEVIGFSTHNAEQLALGNAEPVEYLSLGPIFETTSKLRPDPVVGVEGLRTLRPLTKKPLVAIGGITLANSAEVLSAGADALAVISGFLPKAGGQGELKRLTAQWLKQVGS
jgi:thiamine-phosphate pyrophosphorylase